MSQEYRISLALNAVKELTNNGDFRRTLLFIECAGVFALVVDGDVADKEFANVAFLLDGKLLVHFLQLLPILVPCDLRRI